MSNNIALVGVGALAIGSILTMAILHLVTGEQAVFGIAVVFGVVSPGIQHGSDPRAVAGNVANAIGPLLVNLFARRRATDTPSAAPQTVVAVITPPSTPESHS